MRNKDLEKKIGFDESIDYCKILERYNKAVEEGNQAEAYKILDEQGGLFNLCAKVHIQRVDINGEPCKIKNIDNYKINYNV